MKRRHVQWLRLVVPGCLLLQLSACIGDPQFLLASFVSNTIVSNLVSTLVNLVISGLTTTTTLLG